MALPPTLKAFKDRLEGIGYASRSSYQDSLLEELKSLDGVVEKGTVDKSINLSETRMTSPGQGCPCCGR